MKDDSKTQFIWIHIRRSDSLDACIALQSHCQWVSPYHTQD